MASICAICQDSLSQYSTVAVWTLDQKIPVVVATKCGHVFHEICILGWFRAQDCVIQKNASNHHIPMARTTAAVNRKNCPVCNKIANSEELIKLHLTEEVPAVGHENDGVARAREELKTPANSESMRDLNSQTLHLRLKRAIAKTGKSHLKSQSQS